MNAQEMIVGHVLPIAASVAVLWVAYRLLFSNSNRLKFNRLYLLTSLLFALALPLMGLFVGHEAPQVVTLKQNLFGGSMLNEIVVTPKGQPVMPEATMVAEPSKTHFSLWQILGGLYLIGVAVMTLLFLFKLGRLVALIIRSPKRKMDGYTAVFTGREQGSFSFFRYAFFPDENVAPDIVRHEVSHISHRHSWDILFAEVMMILQWFNPFIYLYKKELQSLHEYQADRDVVATGIDKRNYMMLILQQCTAGDFSGMSNNFSLILTKKRIKMITRNEKAKGLWWRLLATLPVLAILLVANTKMPAQEIVVANSDNDIAFQAIKEDLYQTLKDKAVNDSIFQIVDEMPEFPGGVEAMMKYIAENIKYPQEARDKEIAGRVFLGFVVEKDGSVSQVKVLRSIGGGCDDEAVRVVKAMPKWKPGIKDGKPVRVSYMLPVNFKLWDGEPSKGLDNTKWEGTGTGKKDGTNYTMKMDMEFESKSTGYFVMTLTANKEGQTTTVFEDVGLPFTYSFDGKKIGAIQPTNPDGSQLGEEPMPPYGFLMNSNGTITVSFYDFKEDIGVEQIVFKKVTK